MRDPSVVLNNLNSNACNKVEYKFERLYRNLYNTQFYLMAYNNIYANQGNMTPGTDRLTIDGTSMERIQGLIEKIKNYSYHPAPVRRTYIPKKNGKLRPLGVPSFEDKLVQEVIRMILENIFEPTFSKNSHGYRPGRSCHTALKQIQISYTGVKWFIEGDIKGFFDNVDHHILVKILKKHIQDESFINLIWKFLKAGYMEDWKYYKTNSGTPQGSIISPILSNIYLNELDIFMEKYKKEFDKGNVRSKRVEYWKLINKLKWQRYKLKGQSDNLSEEEKYSIKGKIKEIGKELFETVPGDPMDRNFKRILYVRYADDFLVGVIGSKEETVEIKNNIKKFLAGELNLEMSDEKTLITNGKDKANFLGYQITINNNNDAIKNKNGQKHRYYLNRVKMYIPKEKWLNKLLEYKVLKIYHDENNKEKWKPIHRAYLVNADDVDIVRQYNSEIRGLYNYYCLAHNASVLNDFNYIMEYSMYKTFACKYKSSVQKILEKFCKDGKFGIKYNSKGLEKILYFYDDGFKKKKYSTIKDPDIIRAPRRYKVSSELTKRLLSERCEFCGKENSNVQTHHVRKLKDLSGNKKWERIMIQKNRKTLILCEECHEKLHAGSLD